MPPRQATRCVRCVLTTEVPGVHLDSDNVCNFCRSERGTPTPQEQESVGRIWERRRRDGKPVVVAFSGGADSAACLIYLTRTIHLPCAGILVDNGFIPDVVKRRAKAQCERLGVELRVKSFSLLDLLPRRFSDPCRVCLPEVLARVYETAHELGSSTVATGHLYGPAVQFVTTARGGLFRVAPLYCDRVGETARERLLGEAGWDHDIAYGSSSNCLLLGYIEYHYRRRFGYSPAVAELSHEIRAGMISRPKAIAHLDRPVVYVPEYDEIERMMRNTWEVTA